MVPAPTPRRGAAPAQRSSRNWIWLLLIPLILILCLGAGGLGYLALNPGDGTPTADLPATLAAQAATQTAIAVSGSVAPPVNTDTPALADTPMSADTATTIPPSDTPVPADTPVPTDTPRPPTPTTEDSINLPDLFQEGLIVEEQALGGAYTGPQKRTILSIQGPKVITERQRGANTYADTSLLNSGHYLGNDGSAPWIPSPVLRALLIDGIAQFNTNRDQHGVMLELLRPVIYPAQIDGLWVDLPALEVRSSQGDVYIVLDDPQNPYVLDFSGGPTASGYNRYVQAFVTGQAPPEPPPPPARRFTVVYPGTDGLSLRDGPSTSHRELAILRARTEVEATGGAVRGSDGLTWWPIISPQGDGWVAEWAGNWRLIKPIFEPGETVVVYNPQSTGNVNLRSGSCAVTQVLPRGTELLVLDGPATKCDDRGASMISQGRRWWYVSTPGGQEGWVADFTSAPDKRMLVAPQWYLDLVVR
jgi:hypothetical protein